ncbi:uncharacterized protein LOC141654947 [Silene latifolia]|uniref:uncharacterized protein LOC141654947 n=1 Tax=Silene latifolia TaxID=37657 RepID=UPI003D776B6E
MEDGNSSKNNKGKAIMKLPIPPLPPKGPTGETSRTRNRANVATERRGRPRTPTQPPSTSFSDRLMPVANVVRIMRKVLPPHAKISDEAKFAIQESVTEFISFVTEEANQRCLNEERKTVTGEDLLCSMKTLGFDDYVDPLARYLEKYRDMEGLSHPRRLIRPRMATHHNLGGLMPGPTIMVPPLPLPPMPMYPNYNTQMFPASGQQNNFGYASGGSSSTAPPAAYLPNIPREDSCSSLINRLNFDLESAACIHDEVEFDAMDLPADAASPTGSTSATYIPPENDSVDPFAPFK